MIVTVTSLKAGTVAWDGSTAGPTCEPVMVGVTMVR
jgi:hypothetical protein